MDTLKVTLMYSGLPKKWASPENYEGLNSVRKEEIYNTLKTKVVDKPGNTIFVKGDGGYLYHLLSDITGSSKIKGIDFKKFFSESLSKEQPSIPKAPYVFVYNVGTEQAINTAYASKILSGIVTTLTDRNSWAIIVSDYPHATFYKNYGIEIPNSLTFPSKRQKNIF